jgi:two-component sensor histidine kinase
MAWNVGFCCGPKYSSDHLELTTANEILIKDGWDQFSLFQLAIEVTAPFTGPDRARLTVEGADVMLPRKYNEPIALVLHELATNAAKYGALSTEEGRGVVTCVQQEAKIVVLWTEEGGPTVKAPARKGFGSKLLGEISGRVFNTFTHDFQPHGVTCRMEIDVAV